MYSQTGWEVFTCLGGSVGAVSSSGIGLAPSYRYTQTYLQAELRGGLRVRLLGPVFARFELGVAVPLIRDHYVYTQASGEKVQVFQAYPVVPLGHLGLEIRAP